MKKLINIFKSRLFTLFIVAIATGALALDSIKYPGFVGNHFVIDAKVYAIIALIDIYFIVKIKSKLSKVISLSMLLLLFLTALVYVFFIFKEAIHFPNYVLSVYHFHLDGLVFLVLYFLSMVLLIKISEIGRKLPNRKGLLNIFLFFLTGYTIFSNMGMSFEKAFEQDSYIFTHLADSYNQKMFYQWHDFYNYMLFVKTNTPEDASIIIPPQIAPWWTRSGNMGLVRYFLYPRNIIQYDSKEIPNIKSLHQGTYIMIAWGEWGCDQYGCIGWPTQIIPSREAIFKDPNSNNIKEIRQNFVYDPKDTSNPFGLLKI